MSAVAQESALCVCGSDHLCACGCGREIHPMVRRVHELIASGALVTQVARLLEIDKAQVYVYRTKPPRFLEGHYAKGRARPKVECANSNCKRTFTQMGDNHLYCTYASRGPRGDERDECSRLASVLRNQKWRDLDDRVAGRTAGNAEASAKRQLAVIAKTLDEIAAVQGDSETAEIVARQKFETIRWPKRQLLYGQGLLESRIRDARVSVEEEFESMIENAVRRVRWRKAEKERREADLKTHIEESPELAALIEEQAKEDRFGNHTWGLGLRLDKDYAHGGGDPDKLGGSGDMHEVIGEQRVLNPTETDPLDLYMSDETAERLIALTGGREIEDVMRMDGRSLDWLQERLRAEGFTPSGIQRSERDRLRDPVTHSGKDYRKAPLIPGKKKRRQKVEHKASNRARGNSNRPSQKPRKRWTRDEDYAA